MDNKWLQSSIFVVGFLVFLSGCIYSKLPNQISTSTAKTIETLLISLTPTKRFTNTFTPVSTLPANDAYVRVNQFLNSRSNCHLPCWLGIIPGQSSLINVSEQLIKFSYIATDSFSGVSTGNWLVTGLTIPYYLEDNNVIEIKTGYLNNVGENNISVTEFSTRTYKLDSGIYSGDVYGYPFYSELLKKITISEVLSSNGQPDQIYVSSYLRNDMLVTPGYGDHFDLHVWYPNDGIFMTYKMAVESEGNNYRMCPSTALISGDLTLPNLGDNFDDALLKLGSKYQGFFPPSSYNKSLEDAFGIPIEEFYRIFSVPTDHCLETPKSIWLP
jgi:hypothetical protein